MKRTATDIGHARNVRPHEFENRLRGYLADLTAAELGQVAAQAQRKTVAQLNRSAIAGRIKEAREESGLTQEEMALAMHVYKRTWQNYENVKQPRIPWDRIEDIAEITGKPTDWLLHGHRGTPDLMGVAHEDTLEDVRDDLRPYVEEILAQVKRNKLEIDEQNKLLAEQSELLEQQRGLLADLREESAQIRAALRLLPAVQRLLEAEAEAAGLPPVEQPASEVAEVPAAGEGRPRRAS